MDYFGTYDGDYDMGYGDFRDCIDCTYNKKSKYENYDLDYSDNEDNYELDYELDHELEYKKYDNKYMSKRQIKKLTSEKRVQIFRNLDVYNKTQDFLFCIEKELMEKTWHPVRYMSWCLDINEQKELDM